MNSRASLNAGKRKISCSAWNRRVIPLSSQGPAQPVAAYAVHKLHLNEKPCRKPWSGKAEQERRSNFENRTLY
jgi:hypothetical protein